MHLRPAAIEHGHVHAAAHHELGQRHAIGLVQIEDDAGSRMRTARSKGSAKVAAAVPGARPRETAPEIAAAGGIDVRARLLALAQDDLRGGRAPCRPRSARRRAWCG